MQRSSETLLHRKQLPTETVFSWRAPLCRLVTKGRPKKNTIAWESPGSGHPKHLKNGCVSLRQNGVGGQRLLRWLGTLQTSLTQGNEDEGEAKPSGTVEPFQSADVQTLGIGFLWKPMTSLGWIMQFHQVRESHTQLGDLCSLKRCRAGPERGPFKGQMWTGDHAHSWSSHGSGC